MSKLGVRLALPCLALALGSWLGAHGLPVVTVAHASPALPTLAGPSNDDPPPPVDATLLPDPGPWPELNPTRSLARAWLLAEGPAREPRDGRRFVTLTFDDGPHPDTTPGVLELLRKQQVHAAFFVIGRYLEGDDARAKACREALRSVVAEGHFVGTHTQDHALLTNLSPLQAAAEIDDGVASVVRVTGQTPTLFRPPYGAVDASTEATLRDRGQSLVLWSVEAGDMKTSDADEMTRSLEGQLDYRGGGVVLLHDVHRSTLTVLKNLLGWLHARRFDPAHPERPGYVLTDLLTYQKETAARPQPYADRGALEDARAARWRTQHPTQRAPEDVSDEADPY